MECNFVVGQHVVSLLSGEEEWKREFNAGTSLGPIRFKTAINFPMRGVVYTILSLEVGATTGDPCVSLVELGRQSGQLLINDDLYNFDEVIWTAKQFRPLQKIKVEDFMKVVEPV